MGNKTTSNMPWIGEKDSFPRPDEEGFENYKFTPEQLEIIHQEDIENTRNETAASIIRAISKIDVMDIDEASFIKVIKAVVNAI